MSTTMPDEAAITVEPDHVTQLRENGPGSLILCRFATRRVRVGQPGTVPATDEAIIAGIDDITAMAEQAPFDGAESGDAAAAAEFSDLAAEFLHAIPSLWRPGRNTYHLRTAMINAGFVLTGSTEYRRRVQSLSLTDRYVFTEDPNLRVSLTTDATYIVPVSARVRDMRHDSSLFEVSVGVTGVRPDSAPRIVAAAIAAALHG